MRPSLLGTGALAGALFQRLLTESCRSEVQQAVKYEGPLMIRQAFTVLGQASVGELISAPEVRDGMRGLNKYVDQQKLKELFAPEPPK